MLQQKQIRMFHEMGSPKKGFTILSNSLFIEQRRNYANGEPTLNIKAKSKLMN